MPWSVGPPSWPGALQGSQGGFGAPGRVASLWVCLTRSQHRWDGALLANLKGLLWLPVQPSGLTPPCIPPSLWPRAPAIP